MEIPNTCAHVSRGCKIFELLPGSNQGVKGSSGQNIFFWFSVYTANSNQNQNWHKGWTRCYLLHALAKLLWYPLLYSKDHTYQKWSKLPLKGLWLDLFTNSYGKINYILKKLWKKEGHQSAKRAKTALCEATKAWNLFWSFPFLITWFNDLPLFW